VSGGFVNFISKRTDFYQERLNYTKMH